MSPLWRERVTVGFYPDRLVLARARGEETIAVPPCEAPAERWRAALEALAGVESLRRAEVTVVLSSKGWIRAAKGHDVDAATLSYRDGDGLLQAMRGRSTQQVAFIDSTGRAYSTAAHTLPSARGNGDPLTGRFQLPSGASFVVQVPEAETPAPL